MSVVNSALQCKGTPLYTQSAVFFCSGCKQPLTPPTPTTPPASFCSYCSLLQFFRRIYRSWKAVTDLLCSAVFVCVCVCVCSWWQWRRRLTRWPTTSPGRSTGSLMGGRPVRAGGLACRWDGWYGRCFKIDAPLKFVSNKLGPPLWPAKFWKIFFLPLK